MRIAKVVCPMCLKLVSEFKKNCHVIPRAFVKTTKFEGKNISIDFKSNSININQSDDMGNFWCVTCEEESALLDGYAASVLLHRTKATLNGHQGQTAIFQVFSGLDYWQFKKFIISIAIRDYLNKMEKKKETLFSKEIFRKLKKEFNEKSDEMLIVGNYLPDNDPMGRTIFSHVRNRSKDGINFQLINFSFQLYFVSRQDIKPAALSKAGVMYMLELSHQEHGSYEDLDKNYQKIINDQKNIKQVEKIRQKYDN